MSTTTTPITRRALLRLAGATAATSLVPAWARAAAPAMPNVVLILADDLGWADLGCCGSAFYETPHLDRLAARGIRFTQAYAACPMCSPTRASILTGKYPARVGITEWINPGGGNQPEKWNRPTRLLPAPYRDRLALEEVTLAEAFREAGYATGSFGKWHLGPQGFYPEDQGFDVNRGGCERGGTRHFPPYALPNLPDGPKEEYLADRLTDEALRFIEAKRDRPFFVYLPHYDVHTPLASKQAVIEKYRGKAEALGIGDDRRWRPEGERKDRRVQDHAVYGAMMECLDENVGRVLAKLDALKLAERTLVLFFSDNGGLSTAEGSPTSNAPLRAGKGWLYEGGVREPLLVRGPGVAHPGSVCDAPVVSTDLYPTLLEVAGLPLRPRQHVDGVSLAPLLAGRRLDRGPIYWHYPHYSNQGGFPGGAIRDGDWKLIENYEDGRVELYNLRDDPGEANDLAPANKAKADELLAKLRAWRTNTGAVMPSSNPRWPGRT